MDVLSAVLETNKVHGVFWCDARYRDRWGLRIAHPAAGFHVVIEGACWLMLDGEAPRQLMQGDVVLIPSGAPHVIADAPDTPPVDLSDVAAVQRASASGGTRMACGAFRFAHGTPPALVAVLPKVLHVRAAEVQSDELLRTVLRLLVAELGSTSPGASVLVDRLVDALFVALVRRWLATQPTGGGGWLGALRDERIGKAMVLLHNEPHRRWTVDALARASGLSKTVFARRFCELVGEPPLSWLASVRVDVATRLLETTDRSVAEIATLVGYDSEFAFSRAFKRATGRAPSHHRVARRTALAPS